MLKNIRLPADRHFENGTQNEPIEFYLNSLCNSTRWDLLLGYFSSASINVLSLGFATFIHNGGVLRLVINNVLSQEDKDTIILSKTENLDLPFNLTDINKLSKSLDQYNKHFFECIAYLIANERIQIKIIAPKGGTGISHYKSGQFSDCNDSIFFHGSCNMTAYGLLNNLEEVDLTTSWDNDLSATQVKSSQKRFESIFNGTASHVLYLDIDNVKTAIREEFGDKDINELLIKEGELLSLKKASFGSSAKVTRIINNVNSKIHKITSEPKFPFPEPKPYQIKAYRNWCENDKKGIFAMATGTGKTVTSLNCVLQEYQKTEAYRALIVVPTVALVEQWEKECKKFNFNRIYLINSQVKWYDEVSGLQTEYLLNNKISFILITTYASFVKPNFQSLIHLLPTDTLLIADEAHNIGAKNVSDTLKDLLFTKRIGLSATPERQYDEIGNKLINTFFNNEYEYTFSYTMEEAINNGDLCRYKYYPHLVSLTISEQEKYNVISKELAKLFNSNTEDSFLNNPVVQAKLLKRKRIIHKAVNKLQTFKKILNVEFENRGTLKYSLVYVPEGLVDIENDEEFSFAFNHDDIYIENSDDVRLIDDYTKAVRDINERIVVQQYTSRTSNREQVLKQFVDGQIDVLTSMKCLDEGVDVPRAELAIFCASTGNPRQFIQRRGRILRTHINKRIAIIHDLVVTPVIAEDSDCFEMERNLMQKELQRVINFSKLANNGMDTFIELEDVLNYYNLNLYE